MDASVASPVHSTKDAYYKGYTTLLPNTGIYNMNVSTNKCTSGVRGRPRNNIKVYTVIHFSRQNLGENRKEPKWPENSQYSICLYAISLVEVAL